MQTTRKETETIECTDDDDERIARLVIEAGKYLGKITGESIDRGEVVEQAKANGYSHKQARSLLEAKGRTIEIPDRDDLFGRWHGGRSFLRASTTHSESTVESFRDWLAKKREDNTTEYDNNPVEFDPQHNWSHWQAQKNFARAKDIDRWFWDSCDQFSTVLITRTADRNADLLLEQTKELKQRTYQQCRYRKLTGLSSEYAMVEVLAPKYPTDAEKDVRTHVHTGIWLKGAFEKEDLKKELNLLKEKHMTDVKGASSAKIKVKNHNTNQAYPPVCNGEDENRGGTSRLPHELAAKNQPLMDDDVDTDALELHDERALRWCATLSAGSDANHSTRGMGYWKELGNFKSYANEIRDRRESST